MDNYYTRIHKINSFGEVVWSKFFESGNTQGALIVVDPSGSFIAQIDETKFIAFDSDGQELWGIHEGIIGRPKSLSIGGDGFIYLLCSQKTLVVINNEVKYSLYYITYKIDPKGNIVWSEQSPQEYV